MKPSSNNMKARYLDQSFAIPINALVQTIFSVFRKPASHHSNENIFKKFSTT
jgi:fructose-1,6-bisphosphatase